MEYDYKRLITNAYFAKKRCKSEWGQKYWARVMTELVDNMQKQRPNLL